MAQAIVKKVGGQTDQRILGLSDKAFEEEFGFKPEDKIEQRHFANTGERLMEPEVRKRMEEMDRIRKDAAARRAAQ